MRASLLNKPLQPKARTLLGHISSDPPPLTWEQWRTKYRGDGAVLGDRSRKNAEGRETLHIAMRGQGGANMTD